MARFQDSEELRAVLAGVWGWGGEGRHAGRRGFFPQPPTHPNVSACQKLEMPLKIAVGYIPPVHYLSSFLLSQLTF